MFASKKCVPCTPGTKPIDVLNARRMLEHVPGWDLAMSDRALKRRIVFKDFLSALAFVNQVGELAEAEGHHPDIMFGWGYAECVLWTHDIAGLHENDFVMAAKINQLLA